VPESAKQERMMRMVQLYRSEVEKIHRKMEGTKQLVLVEGVSRNNSDISKSCSDLLVLKIIVYKLCKARV
jgi:tRNA A37 methylthiotransferase MiaB